MEIENQKKSKKIYILAVVIILVFSLGAFLFYFVKNKGGNGDSNNSNMAKNQEFNSADFENINFGDPSVLYNKSEELRKLLETGKFSAKDEGEAKVILGKMYMFFYEERLSEGIKILSQVASDTKFSKEARAEAILTLTGSYEISHNDAVFVANLFGNDPFKSFFQESQGDVPLALAKLNEFSDEIYPSFVSQYKAAKIYALQFTIKKDLTAEQKEAYLSKAKKFLEKGKQTLPNLEEDMESMITRGNESDFDINNLVKGDYKKGIASLDKALALDSLYINKLDSNIKENDVFSAYQQSFLFLEKEPSSEVMKNYAYFGRINFAYFLAQIDEKGNVEKIKEILVPFYVESISTSMFLNVLARYRKGEDSKMKSAIEKLPQIDPRFKVIVENIDKNY